jgi:anaerobic ribonucleoside-triphosphate reductase activating protein
MSYRYAGLKTNDATNCAEGICVSFFTQGCPHRCPGCHNPETWDFKGGLPLPADINEQIASAIEANGIKRNFSILGGEPLCEENLVLTNQIVSFVRKKFPHIIIYLWTGYIYEDLIANDNPLLKEILSKINCLIDGPFIQEYRDITLTMRGSANQRVINLSNI